MTGARSAVYYSSELRPTAPSIYQRRSSLLNTFGELGQRPLTSSVSFLSHLKGSLGIDPGQRIPLSDFFAGAQQLCRSNY